MASITLRPVREEDGSFLRALYASTREREMAMVPWSDEQKAAFLGWQFDAQTAHYREAYDAAGFFVVERDGAAIGRLYLDRRDDDIRIVDIALVPEAREGGVGTSLIRGVLEEGARTGRTVSIHVESFNPALRLYERLGFREIDTNGVYKLMKWTGTMSSQATDGPRRT